MDLCSCPLPASLTPVPDNCPFHLKDLFKLAIRRAGQAAATDVATFTGSAYWTGLKAATDDTKVIITPQVEEVVITPGEAVNEPGHDGIEVPTNYLPTMISGYFRNLDSPTWRAMYNLVCEGLLDYTFIDNGGSLVATDNTDAPTFIQGVGKFNFQGPGREVNQSMRVPFSFYVIPTWYADIKKYTPVGFNAKTDL